MKCEWTPPKCNVKFPPCFQKYPGISSKTNPGNILGLHYLANRIKPKFLDGIELDYNHRLASNKFMTANWTLSHNKPSGFRFGGTYTARVTNQIMHTPTIHTDINPTTLSTNVGLLYYPLQCLRIEAELQRIADNANLQTQTCIELCTQTTTITASFYNVRPDSGRGTFSFLRAINERLALGSELLIEWTDPHSVMADIALAGRYRHKYYAVAATASRQGVDISYWQRLHQKIQMASFWAWQRKTDQSLATICYQWNFDNAYVRGTFDSNLSVGFVYSSVFSRFASQAPIGMDMSLLINLPTNRFVFGVKFTLDPSGLRVGE